MPDTESTPLLSNAAHQEKGSRWRETVSADGSLLPLTLCCLTTGLINISAYQATRVWVGFLTGQTLQLGAAIPRAISSGRVETSEWLGVTSLTSFGAGAFLGGVAKRRLGAASRQELLCRSALEVVAIFVPAVLLVASPHGSVNWADAIGFVSQALLSFEQGLQALDGQTLNTELATTVVQTSVWLSYFSLPLSTLLYPGYKRARDHRLLGLSMLLLGGAIGELFLMGTTHLRTAQGYCLLLAAALRLVAALHWLFLAPKAVTARD